MGLFSRSEATESTRVVTPNFSERDESDFVDNTVITSKYTVLTFLPLSLKGQFRRLGNVYFLSMGILMLLGYYTTIFESAISPWTTLGPLAFVVSISLCSEGAQDIKVRQLH